ncbi:MAG TPA: hypothetical protein VKF36_11975 [Syntrophorhabdales bacterium]|nr:hypothetical protein [Syntrophorhabdales bacterium]
MSALVASLIAFGCIFGGTLLGERLRPLLPDHHVSAESKDVLKLGIGMIATLSALVLGLLIASAKGTFDTTSSELKQTSSKIILLDRTMAEYGPETKEARDVLRRSVTSALERVWPEEKTEQMEAKALAPTAGAETVQNKLLQLSPKSDAQRWLQSRALQVSADVAEAGWLLIQQRGESSLSKPFLVMLVCWLTIIFFCFGLFSPRNATVSIVLLICALSVASSLYLIQEMDSPYQGLMKVSSGPLRSALVQLGR